MARFFDRYVLSSSPYLSEAISRRSLDLEWDGEGRRIWTTEAGQAGSRLTRVSLKVIGGSGSILNLTTTSSTTEERVGDSCRATLRKSGQRRAGVEKGSRWVDGAGAADAFWRLRAWRSPQCWVGLAEFLPAGESSIADP